MIPDELLAHIHVTINERLDAQVVDGLRIVDGTLQYDWNPAATAEQRQTVEDNAPAYIQRVIEQAQAERTSRQFMQTLRRRLPEAETNADILALYEDVKAFAANHAEFERGIETIFRVLKVADGDLLGISLSTNKGKAMYLAAALHAAAIWSS
jgi:hypothetical protein